MTIAALAALTMEFYTFRRCMGKVQKRFLDTWQHYLWDGHPNRVILLETGIGPQKAGAALRTLLQTYQVDCLINFGSAGMINKNLQVGRAFLVRDIVNSLNGEVIPTNVQLSDALSLFLNQKAITFHCGRLLTAPVPVAKRSERLRLAQQFQVDAVDMEAFALAEVAAEYDLPFASLKMISDRANALTRLEFWKNVSKVDRHLGKLMYGFMQFLRTTKS